MKRLSTLFVAAAVAVVLLPAAWSAEEPDEERDGKEVFLTHKCNLCHGVPPADIEAETKSDKMKGADLGGPLEADFETIAAYVRKTSDIDGKQHKREFKGTDEELQTILDWLGSLEAQK